MKLNETLKKHNGSMDSKKSDVASHPLAHIATPMKHGAFALNDDEKRKKISAHFHGIMDTLGLDLTNDSLRDTPDRVARMYVDEIFSGLNPANKPVATLFENKYAYNDLLVQKNIRLKSMCEHHFVPIDGQVHVGYISNGYVIGLSKINRIVHYFARRPQVQERLTLQIAEELKRVLKTNDVAVVIDAQHQCVSLRGAEDESSSTMTQSFHGKFKNRSNRDEFLSHL